MKRNVLQKNTPSVPEENNELDKVYMEEEIKKWSTGKAQSLEGLIYVTKERDACQIETCDMGKTFHNQKQAISHSTK